MTVSRRRVDALARLRAWWARGQGLPPAKAPRTLHECLRHTGWMVTAGSAGVYLSIRARMPGLSRDAIDRAVLDGLTVAEVPGAHARPWMLVPRDEAALALRLHLRSYDAHAAAYYRYSGISEATIKGVAAQVCASLDEEPLSSAEIRRRLTHPDAGELLIGALVHLTLRGIVRRLAADGRLDSSSYLYELRHPDDRPDLDGAGDDGAMVSACIESFLRSHGPSTVEELAWRGSLTKGAVRKALQQLGAERIGVPGWSDEAWLLAGDVPAWRRFEVEGHDRVHLLPYRDPVLFGRRPAVLTRTPDAIVLDDKLEPTTVRAAKALRHHTVWSGNEIVGVWEYDPDSEAVVTRLWQRDAALRRRVADAASETAEFIARQLGDLTLSAVDPPSKRARRIEFCATAAAQAGLTR